MDTISMNSENSKTFKPHVLILNVTDKIELRRGAKSIALSNLSIYYTWKNGKTFKKYNNNGSCFISDVQDYFEYILKKHNEIIDNSSIRMYVNKIESRITFKVKTGYYPELLRPETKKSYPENKITKDKNGENVKHLPITEVVLVHFNIVSNDYQ